MKHICREDAKMEIVSGRNDRTPGKLYITSYLYSDKLVNDNYIEGRAYHTMQYITMDIVDEKEDIHDNIIYTVKMNTTYNEQINCEINRRFYVTFTSDITIETLRIFTRRISKELYNDNILSDTSSICEGLNCSIKEKK